MEPFTNMLKTLSYIANIVLVLGLLIAYNDFRTSRMYMQQSAVTSCMERYSSMLEDVEKLKSSELAVTSVEYRNYLNLTSEELFYIQHNMIPEEISYDWMAGILKALYETNYKEFQNNHDQSYSRINYAVGLKGEHTIEINWTEELVKSPDYLRKETIKALKNLRYYKRYLY